MNHHPLSEEFNLKFAAVAELKPPSAPRADVTLQMINEMRNVEQKNPAFCSLQLFRSSPIQGPWVKAEHGRGCSRRRLGASVLMLTKALT